MNHWYFIAPVSAVSGLVLIASGFALGWWHRLIWDKLVEFNNRFKELEDDEDIPAVITTTPQLIDRKRRAGKASEDDEESAIVTIKSPRQLKAEEELKLKAELDEIEGYSSR